MKQIYEAMKLWSDEFIIIISVLLSEISIKIQFQVVSSYVHMWGAKNTFISGFKKTNQ